MTCSLPPQEERSPVCSPDERSVSPLQSDPEGRGRGRDIDVDRFNIPERNEERCLSEVGGSEAEDERQLGVSISSRKVCACHKDFFYSFERGTRLSYGFLLFLRERYALVLRISSISARVACPCHTDFFVTQKSVRIFRSRPGIWSIKEMQRVLRHLSVDLGVCPSSRE